MPETINITPYNINTEFVLAKKISGNKAKW